MSGSGEPGESGESKPGSDLDEGLRGLSRAASGIAARLFGPKIIGKEKLPENPTISPEADQAVSDAGEVLGRVLQAAGRALQAHPLDPEQAIESARAHRDEPVEPPEGWSPLTGGLISLSEGLYKVTEGVLDKVAPRRPKTEGAEDPDPGSERSDEPDPDDDPPRWTRRRRDDE